MSQTRRSKKARKGDRTFQPSAAGKGAQDRTSDVEAYRANYEEINWGTPRPEKKEKLDWSPAAHLVQQWKFDWSVDK